MLVSGLKDSSLSKIISGNSGGYSYVVYISLYECAQAMLDKYRQKQIEPGNSDKLGIKTRAVEILLVELSKVPKDSGATRKMIKSALKCYVKALQGHEHLMSERGNTYALIEQTGGLRERYGDARAFLLQYHDLKKEFLGPGSYLNDEQKKVISKLAEKKGLTLKILKAMEVSPFFIPRALVSLDKAGMLQQDLCAVLVGHRSFSISTTCVYGLERKGMLKPALRDLCVAVIKHEDFMAFVSICRLKDMNLLRPDLWTLVLKQSNTRQAVNALESLYISGMIKQNLSHSELRTLVLRQNSAYQTENALESLRRSRIFEQHLFHSVLTHEDINGAADALMELNLHGLDTPDNCSAVLKQRDPTHAASIIIRLDFYQLLKGRILDKVFEHQKLEFVYDVICYLGETLCTEKNLYAVIHHPDIATLKSGIKNLAESESLDQASFEECLMKPVPVETDEANSTV